LVEACGIKARVKSGVCDCLVITRCVTVHLGLCSVTAVPRLTSVFTLHIICTTYVDAVFCYRRSSVVCLLVGQSVCLSVTIVSTVKTAELIEMDLGFGLGWAQGTMY